MTLQEAKDIINKKNAGFMVSFHEIVSGGYKAKYFPEKGQEPLIPTEDEAWELARQFAGITKGQCFEIYVMKDDFRPVDGYNDKVFSEFPKRQ